MPKWAIAVVVTITTALVLITVSVLQRKPAVVLPAQPDSAAVVLDRGTGERTLAPRPGFEDLRMPEFSLVNQDGEPVDHTVLEGRVSIVAFIFTNCQLACPGMTYNMFRMYNDLAGTPVQFVSISVDPAHDTPARLREYAGNLAVDTGRWMFLTGEEGEAVRVVQEALKFEVSADPDATTAITLGDGSTMQNITHPTQLFLVGPQRQILDLCAPTLVEDRERLTEVAREAAG